MKKTQCPRCLGNGYVYWPREGGGMQPETCLKCNGTGIKPEKK